MVEIIKEVHDDRTQYGYYEDDLFWIDHNDNGPAVIWDYGRQEYRNHGILHRIGGPAVIVTGQGVLNNSIGLPIYNYFVNGNNVNKIVVKWLRERNLTTILSDEDHLALCMFMEGLK